MPFKLINDYPVKDSMAFIDALKKNCHLEVDNEDKQTEKIDHFTKLTLYGSTKFIYLIELDWHSGSMATFPWKYQIIFDEKGKLLKVLHGIRYELIKIFPNSSPFLLSVISTARGNGGHELYRIKNDKLVDVIKYPANFCVRTYDAHEDETVNQPTEFALTLKDVNKDGYNDLVFSGNILLIMGVSKDNSWYDTETLNGKEVTYSPKNPFKTIPIKLNFIYNPHTEIFSPDKDYSNYCTEKLYKLIYK